ncbi:uncharacterized protein [Mytilus edulis]|uniref:uncharacterized protein n=1 Tax=Mytilus edulis TaxID=6550 RepID=UPI0039F0C869
MTDNQSICGVCENRQITKPSILWCFNCEEQLCEDCKEHHSISKGTKNHKTVSIDEYKKLPTEVTKNAMVSTKQNEKYEVFCRKYDFQRRKDEQAQISVPYPTKSIDNLTVTLHKRINTRLSMVRGCSLLPDGRMVFSCYAQNKLRVVRSDGFKDFEINNIGCMFDVIFIGNNCAAVTSGKSYRINIINTKNKQVKKTIEVNPQNDGVAYKNGHLIYCAEKKGLQVISLKNLSVTNIINKELPTRAYVAAFSDQLFYTNRENHSVTCCDYHGNILWMFCNTTVLSHPLGISVDNDGNVFVVGFGSSNVVVISSDGQRYRQILSHEDGLFRPQVLHYDQSNKKLLVANRANDAFLFRVK